MDKGLYTQELASIRDAMEAVANTPFTAFAKMLSLTTMNMRYEKVAFDKGLQRHPYEITAEIIRDAISQFNMLMDIQFIEDAGRGLDSFKDHTLEVLHERLWQEIWPRHDSAEYDEFVTLKADRLRANNLQGLIEGRRCVEFGCGNGAFSIALLELGAAHVTGIDFGTASVEHARKQAARLRLEDSTDFRIAPVTDSGLPNGQFDFAVSNGVFHHLQESQIPKALSEIARVMKPGGAFWYYVDGQGAISMDLWDTTVAILKEIDLQVMESLLKLMNVGRNKAVHIMDGSNAIYIHSSYEQVLSQLRDAGFDDFNRLTGGTGTDFDHDVIDQDPYGLEKFGEGDLRILCRKI